MGIVVNRMGIGKEKLDKLIHHACEVVVMSQKSTYIQKTYSTYIVDNNDAHIVAGAVESHVRFLITYNLKHFRIKKISNDFEIVIMSPAMFLQYLRSI